MFLFVYLLYIDYGGYLLVLYELTCYTVGNYAEGRKKIAAEPKCYRR
jgi:hypothetical protein